jgi:hypothetical protein
MKKLFTLSFAICVLQAAAQTPFPTIAFVDINNIKASVLVHGDMWWNPSTTTSECFFPASTDKNIGFNAALWMSGYDASSQLHISAQTYRQNGNDYWPGPLDGTTGALDLATSTKWAKIWKVNRTTINTFRADTTSRTASSTNPSILQWPGKGNAYARGAGTATLTIDRDMAPFIDLNGNGTYEPLLGEYPDIKGDQGLWWLFSDNGPTHDETLGLPLGVEVKTLAYAYSRGTLIDNVIFYEYTVTNRSANNYTNFRLGQFADMDLGAAFNDYVGFDSVHRMGIVYNGQPNDSVYGNNMPIAGITMIILPGDTATSYVPAGSFLYYNNDASVIGNPVGDTQYNYYLRASTRAGTHITNDYTAAGVPTVGYGSGPSTNYVYPGDPSDLTKWSECSSGNTPGDRRFVITSNDFTLPAGATRRVVMALVTTNLDTNNACGKPVHFTDIITVADTAWKTFFTPLPPMGVNNEPVIANIKIYPNPAHDRLYVETTETATEETITVYNNMGQIIVMPFSKSGNRYECNLNGMPAGIYHMVYRNSGGYKASTFIKN